MYSLPQTIAKKMSGKPYDQLDISNQKYGNECILCCACGKYSIHAIGEKVSQSPPIRVLQPDFCMERRLTRIAILCSLIGRLIAFSFIPVDIDRLPFDLLFRRGCWKMY